MLINLRGYHFAEIEKIKNTVAEILGKLEKGIRLFSKIMSERKIFK